MPTSNEMRVRVEVLVKIMPTALPASTACATPRLLGGLQLDRQVEQRADLVGRVVVHGEEVTAGEAQSVTRSCNAVMRPPWLTVSEGCSWDGGRAAMLAARPPSTVTRW